MARNRSEKMPAPPECWDDCCIQLARLTAEDLAGLYPPTHVMVIRQTGWAYSASPPSPAVRLYRNLSYRQAKAWDSDIAARRAYVAAAFLEAHGKKQK